jgi:hypothetical protein
LGANFDSDGGAQTAADALAVLRMAVGPSEDLDCPVCSKKRRSLSTPALFIQAQMSA